MLARPLAALCALSAALALAACGHPSEEAGIEEPAREGLAIPIGGAEYNVFLTRQLNQKIVPDKAYYDGPEPAKDETIYGVFIQVCNQGDEPVSTADSFTVKDNQDNEFAYHPRRLAPDECIPESGSVAQLGPTAASMLLFELPLASTENRPLELEITSPEPDSETRTIELDL